MCGGVLRLDCTAPRADACVHLLPARGRATYVLGGALAVRLPTAMGGPCRRRRHAVRTRYMGAQWMRGGVHRWSWCRACVRVPDHSHGDRQQRHGVRASRHSRACAACPGRQEHPTGFGTALGRGEIARRSVRLRHRVWQEKGGTLQGRIAHRQAWCWPLVAAQAGQDRAGVQVVTLAMDMVGRVCVCGGLVVMYGCPNWGRGAWALQPCGSRAWPPATETPCRVVWQRS